MLTFKVIATKDPAKKKRKRWVDCYLELDTRTGLLKLFQLDENGKRGSHLGSMQKRQSGIKAGDELEFESGWSCEVEELMKTTEEVERVISGPPARLSTIRAGKSAGIPDEQPMPSRSARHVLPSSGTSVQGPDSDYNLLASRADSPTAMFEGQDDTVSTAVQQNGSSQASQISLFADCMNDSDIVGRMSVPGPEMPKRPRTDAEILALFGGAETAMEPSGNGGNVDVSDDMIGGVQTTENETFSGREELEIFDEPAEQAPVSIADIVDKESAPPVANRGKVIPPYRPPTQRLVTGATTSSFARPVINTATASVKPAATCGLRAPAPSSSSATPLVRKAFYSLSFPSLDEYAHQLRRGWEEEIQVILDQGFDKSQRCPHANLFKSATLQCVKFGGKTVPAGKRYYLQTSEFRDKSKLFSVGDVWLVAPTSGAEATLWESAWYGASAENKIEVKPISSAMLLRGYFASSAGSNTLFATVIATRGPCIRTELTALRLLEDLPRLQTSTAIAEGLAGLAIKIGFSGTRQDARIVAPRPAESIIDLYVDRFRLNQEQIQVVRTVVSKTFRVNLIGSAQREDWPSPFVMVNGPFGSGKSQTIACCVLVLDAIAREVNMTGKIRIGISAATNVAVDRVLTCLLAEHDFNQVARIGSVRAVDRRLLSKMIHYSKNAVRDARAELIRLKEKDASALDEVNHALDSLSKATEIADEARITGFTCCSSENEEMQLVFPEPLFGDDDGQGSFNVLFLDEGSQMPEPIALLPITNSRANLVCTFGDLKQLPPVSPFNGNVSLPRADGMNASISMTLFERLSRLYPTNVFSLRTSFRCHPDICRLASELFYDGEIVPGATEQDREALIPGLAPITVLDVSNGLERRTSSGSYQNEQECFAIKRVIRAFESAGVDASRLAVATLFVAQAELLRSHVANEKIRVATVDAFQGAESDVLIVSTCRTERSQFSEQMERLNVLLTRARHHLVVVGSRRTLCSSTVWRRVCERSAVFEFA